ncbi:MAG: hypothetical protein PF638_09725 [Candidatus Delongbacteria bacterium]|jgi:Na+-transporting methylmalonyl-CoA/oxaloacetate decarboxylase gamma subunit|nr:hypothetical protein [Candidatus Delongbacteria bacterium]
MNGFAIIIVLILIYIAFNIGKVVGRAESFFKKPESKENVKKQKTTGIEEADYEELEDKL